MRTKSWCQQHNSWCSTHMKSRNFQLRISCNLERYLRILSRKLQLRIREISESDLEIFNSEFWKFVSSFSKSSAPKELFWLTERKERKREEKKNLWIAERRRHTQEKNSEWLQLQTVLISQNQQNLWKTSKPKFFSKLENQENLFENLKTKKSSEKQ